MAGWNEKRVNRLPQDENNKMLAEREEQQPRAQKAAVMQRSSIEEITSDICGTHVLDGT
jgi:hypothetical protein